MDIGRAFSYVTEDERWLTKMLIGGLIGLLGAFIIIGPIILFGYVLETAQNVMRGNPRPLPEWNDIGSKLMKGLSALVIGIVYAIPVILFSCVVGAIAGALTGEGSGAAAGGALLLLNGLSVLLSLAIAPFVYTGLIRYIQTESIGEALRFGEVLSTVQANLGPLLMLFLVSILASLVGQLGAIACGIGLFLTYPYGQAVLAHALGQTALKLSGPQMATEVPPTYGPPSSYQ